MIRFLRLFSAFRRLEAQLREEAGKRITQDDKIRLLSAQVEMLEGKELASKNETIDTLKHFVDFVTKNTTRQTVFGSIVEEAQIGPRPEPVLRSGIHMRSVVHQKTAEFTREEQARSARELQEFYDSQRTTAAQ